MTNLVTNGDFSDGMTGWGVGGDISHAVTDGEFGADFPSVPGAFDNYLNTAVPLPEGGNYVVTFRARSQPDVTLYVQLNGIDKTVDLAAATQQFSLTYNVAAPNPDNVLLFGYGGAATAFSTWLDDVSVSKVAPDLDVQYMPERGYVRFVVTALPAGVTIFRVTDNNKLVPVVGYSTDGWHQPGGTGIGRDYRVPLGETVRYAIAPVGSANLPISPIAEAEVVVPGDQAWLRDVTEPTLSWPVWVITTGTEAEPVRQYVYEVSGRRLPLTVHDVRLGRRGTVQLFVPGPDDRRAIEALLASGRPLLLNICSGKLWAPCMMAVGNASFTRWGTGPRWILDLEYIEVDSPTAEVTTPETEVTWQDVLDDHPTWQDVFNDHNGWLSVAIYET